MKKGVCLFIMLVAIMGALDALQPFYAGRTDPAASITAFEIAELLSFAAVAIIGAIAFFMLKRRAGK